MPRITGSTTTYANSVQAYVDVRDVADACILLFETPFANGRYLCAESVVHRAHICSLLQQLFPQYPIPSKYVAFAMRQRSFQNVF
jgi:cinnamoyl-CoA reductase